MTATDSNKQANQVSVPSTSSQSQQESYIYHCDIAVVILFCASVCFDPIERFNQLNGV